MESNFKAGDELVFIGLNPEENYRGFTVGEKYTVIEVRFNSLEQEYGYQIKDEYGCLRVFLDPDVVFRLHPKSGDMYKYVLEDAPPLKKGDFVLVENVSDGWVSIKHSHEMKEKWEITRFVKSFQIASRIRKQPKNTFTTLSEIVDQLSSCNFECLGGKLTENAAFNDLKEMARTEIQEKLKSVSESIIRTINAGSSVLPETINQYNKLLSDSNK